MPKFWSFVGNEKYDVGCTGQTVYVYLKDGTEVARFKDITYAYTPLISPDGRFLVVKSTEGKLAAYSLETLSLICKFRFSKVNEAQDDGFCFSPDGKYLYNVERHMDSCKTALSVYDTRGFSLIRRVLGDDYSLVLNSVECDDESGEIFLLGYRRDEETGVAGHFFVGRLDGDALADVKHISPAEHHRYRVYLGMKMTGFTKEACKWSRLNASSDERKSAELSLVKLWQDNKTERTD